MGNFNLLSEAIRPYGPCKIACPQICQFPGTFYLGREKLFRNPKIPSKAISPGAPSHGGAFFFQYFALYSWYTGITCCVVFLRGRLSGSQISQLIQTGLVIAQWEFFWFSKVLKIDRAFGKKQTVTANLRFFKSNQ